jgi:molybdopterin synthase sulfur carrier subunit
MSEVPTRRVKLLYFAWVREKIGRGAEEIELPEGLATVADVVGWLKTRGPQFDEAFARPELVRAAVDRVHVKPAALILSAREIAFFPPVTGG